MIVEALVIGCAAFTLGRFFNPEVRFLSRLKSSIMRKLNGDGRRAAYRLGYDDAARGEPCLPDRAVKFESKWVKP